MVGQMTDIGKHKRWLCLMAAFVLLSFFYMAPVRPEGTLPKPADADGVECGLSDMSGMSGLVISNAMNLHGADCRPEACTDNISAARIMLDEIATREQQPRILLARFLAVVSLLILFVRVICKLLIRRYGCHMIDLWQNIYYIHLVDGKKGKRLLDCYIRR